MEPMLRPACGKPRLPPRQQRIVGDEDDAAIFFVGQPLQNPDNIPAVFLVQIAGRLVGQDDLAACRQGSCDGDPLLLTAGQGGG